MTKVPKKYADCGWDSESYQKMIEERVDKRAKTANMKRYDRLFGRLFRRLDNKLDQAIELAKKIDGIKTIIFVCLTFQLNAQQIISDSTQYVNRCNCLVKTMKYTDYNGDKFHVFYKERDDLIFILRRRAGGSKGWVLEELKS